MAVNALSSMAWGGMCGERNAHINEKYKKFSPSD